MLKSHRFLMFKFKPINVIASKIEVPIQRFWKLLDFISSNINDALSDYDNDDLYNDSKQFIYKPSTKRKELG